MVIEYGLFICEHLFVIIKEYLKNSKFLQNEVGLLFKS